MGKTYGFDVVQTAENVKEIDAVKAADNVKATFNYTPDAKFQALLKEAGMISAEAEDQLLQLLVRFGRVERALDIGSFTGFSASALEALPELQKIDPSVEDAQALLKHLATKKESFDLIFFDESQPGSLPLYELLMKSGLLRVAGCWSFPTGPKVCLTSVKSCLEMTA